MNNALVTSIVLVFVGTIIGLLLGHYHGSKEVYRMEWSTKNRLARYETALKEVANWENYNSGGDVGFGKTHPAKIAEDALKD